MRGVTRRVTAGAASCVVVLIASASHLTWAAPDHLAASNEDPIISVQSQAGGVCRQAPQLVDGYGKPWPTNELGHVVIDINTTFRIWISNGCSDTNLWIGGFDGDLPSYSATLREREGRYISPPLEPGRIAFNSPTNRWAPNLPTVEFDYVS